MRSNWSKRRIRRRSNSVLSCYVIRRSQDRADDNRCVSYAATAKVLITDRFGMQNRERAADHIRPKDWKIKHLHIQI